MTTLYCTSACFLDFLYFLLLVARVLTVGRQKFACINMFNLVLAVFFVLATPSQAMTSNELADVEASIAAEFSLQPSSYGEPCEPCAQGDAVGGLVRLAFHDAAGGGGRSNGCVDVTEPENSGLAPIIAQLEQAWRPFADVLSFADAVVVAGNLAIRVASTPSPNADNGGGGNLNGRVGAPEGNGGAPLRLQFRSGRPDVASCDDTDQLPGATFSWENSQQFFGQKFGLSATEIVALFGAHSVGRAQAVNTGIEGGWTAFQSSFSTNYYKELVLEPWNKRSAADWRDRQNHLQLTSDVETVISPTGACSGFNVRNDRIGGNCPANQAILATVQRFAGTGGTAAWYAAFSSAWIKMTETGHSNLVTIDDDPPTPAPPTPAPPTPTPPAPTPPTPAPPTPTPPTPAPPVPAPPTPAPPTPAPPTSAPPTPAPPTPAPPTPTPPTSAPPVPVPTPNSNPKRNRRDRDRKRPNSGPTATGQEPDVVPPAPAPSASPKPVLPVPPPPVPEPANPPAGQCSLQGSGFYLQAINACSAYVRCNGNNVVGDPSNCSFGTLFNNDRQFCDWPSNVNCQGPPSRPDTGVQLPPAPAPPESDSPPAPLIPAPGPLTSAPPGAEGRCSLQGSSFYLQAINACSAYVRCNGNNVVGDPSSCSSGTLFSNDRQFCDWPSNVNCL